MPMTPPARHTARRRAMVFKLFCAQSLRRDVYTCAAFRTSTTGSTTQRGVRGRQRCTPST
eukprot:1180139-Prorocentrum_minimum.AAC.1